MLRQNALADPDPAEPYPTAVNGLQLAPDPDVVWPFSGLSETKWLQIRTWKLGVRISC